MNLIKILFKNFYVLIFTLGVTTPVYSGQLKIVSWNIANLAQEPGKSLRGHARTAEDYEQIRAQIASLSPDVIALQEIGSIKGARAILGANYTIHFETRCGRATEDCASDRGDIFTAIAYRSTLAKSAEEFQIDALSIPHQSECASAPARHVRGGVGIKLKWNRKTYAIASLHMKASCKRNGHEKNPDLSDDCKTLAKQFDILNAWIAAPAQRNDVLILAGDYNRELLHPDDDMRSKLLRVAPDLRFEPKRATRHCWSDARIDIDKIRHQAKLLFPEIQANGGFVIPFTPLSNRLIDYFVIRNLPNEEFVSSGQVLMGKRQRVDPPASYLQTCAPHKPKQFDGGGVLTFSPAHPSDHCPISLVISN